MYGDFWVAIHTSDVQPTGIAVLTQQHSFIPAFVRCDLTLFICHIPFPFPLTAYTLYTASVQIAP